jgi:hypothetical protein
VRQRLPSWRPFRRMEPTGRYVQYFTSKVVSNMYYCANLCTVVHELY